MYAAINVIWMLMIGTAGIFSLASLATVGVGAYGSSYLSVYFGFPWWAMWLTGPLFGLVFGVVIAIPAIRLEGFYYALLTRRHHGVVPRLCHSEPNTRLGQRLAGRRQLRPPQHVRSRRSRPRLLPRIPAAARRLGSISRGQRPAPWPPAARGAREARGLCRGARHRLSHDAHPGIPDLVGGIGGRRRLLRDAASRRHAFAVHHGPAAAAAGDGRCRRHRHRRRRGRRHR